MLNTARNEADGTDWIDASFAASGEYIRNGMRPRLASFAFCLISVPTLRARHFEGLRTSHGRTFKQGTVAVCGTPSWSSARVPRILSQNAGDKDALITASSCDVYKNYETWTTSGRSNRWQKLDDWRIFRKWDNATRRATRILAQKSTPNDTELIQNQCHG